METTDLAIIAQVKNGEPDAFRLIVDRYSRPLFRLAFRMLGNQQDAEDAVQETFLRAYRQLHQFDMLASFHTWLYRIATNYCLDLIRSGKRLDRAGFEPELVAGHEPAADRLALNSQMSNLLNSALDGLTPQERIAFVLRHFEGQSIQEIGGTMGITGNATKQSIFRAVQKLRLVLEPFVSAASGGVR